MRKDQALDRKIQPRLRGKQCKHWSKFGAERMNSLQRIMEVVATALNRLLDLKAKETKQVIDAGVARQRKSTWAVVEPMAARAGLVLLRWGRW